MSNVINFKDKQKELKIKKVQSLENQRKILESILNKENFNNMDEVINYYQNVINFKQNTNDFVYETLGNDLIILKDHIEYEENRNKKILELYNKFHNEKDYDKELAYVVILTKILDINPSIISEEKEVIEEEVYRIFGNQKEEINYEIILENMLDNNEFKHYNDIYLYYTDLSNVKKEEIDDGIYELINNRLLSLKNLNKELNKKVINIYNKYHKLYKNNNELYYISIITDLLSDFSILMESEENIIKIIDKKIKSKQLN